MSKPDSDNADRRLPSADHGPVDGHAIGHLDSDHPSDSPSDGSYTPWNGPLESERAAVAEETHTASARDIRSFPDGSFRSSQTRVDTTQSNLVGSQADVEAGPEQLKPKLGRSKTGSSSTKPYSSFSKPTKWFIVGLGGIAGVFSPIR